MVKFLAVAIAALMLAWAPVALAGHGGGELLRSRDAVGVSR